MLQPTDTKIEVKDYPYGYLKTSMFFSLEFKSSKGFRSVRQTINPKTGRINKPKKSTYSQILLLDSTDGFCSFKGFEFYKDKDFNKIMTFLGDIFELFTKEQIQYLYIKAINFTKITAQSTVTYCNSEVSEVLKIIEPTVDALLKGLKSGENNFASITLDHEALKATKEEGYQPFKMVNYA